MILIASRFVIQNSEIKSSTPCQTRKWQRCNNLLLPSRQGWCLGPSPRGWDVGWVKKSPPSAKNQTHVGFHQIPTTHEAKKDGFIIYISMVWKNFWWKTGGISCMKLWLCVVLWFFIQHYGIFLNLELSNSSLVNKNRYCQQDFLFSHQIPQNPRKPSKSHINPHRQNTTLLKYYSPRGKPTTHLLFQCGPHAPSLPRAPLRLQRILK